MDIAVPVVSIILIVASLIYFLNWLAKNQDAQQVVVMPDGESALLVLNGDGIHLLDLKTELTIYVYVTEFRPGYPETVVEDSEFMDSQDAAGSDIRIGSGIVHSRYLPESNKFLITWSDTLTII